LDWLLVHCQMSTWELIDVHEEIHLATNKTLNRAVLHLSCICVTTFQLLPVNNNVDDAFIDLVDHSDAFLIVSVFIPLNNAASAHADGKYPTRSSN